MKNNLIHIALVGGQPTPVYQGIVHENPAQIILVCSQNTHQKAEGIRRELKSFADKDILIYDLSDTDINQMYEVASIIEEKCRNFPVSLNLSSGIKVWSLIFFQIFHSNRSDSRIFTIGQDGRIFYLHGKDSSEFISFDAEAQFRLLDNKVSKYVPFSSYDKDDFLVLKTVLRWGLDYNRHEQFRILTESFYNSVKSPDEMHTCRIESNSLSWEPEKNRFLIELSNEKVALSSPNVWHIVLNTGWFEMSVAKALSSIVPASDIWMNCVFKSKSGTEKNEVDIIVNIGQKLIFVECKTQVYNLSDIDKFSSVVKTYGGLGSKALFVINGRIKDDIAEKCKERGITLFQLDLRFKNAGQPTQEVVERLKETIMQLQRESNV